MASGEAFDLVVIGGGPGGYTAGVRAAELGMKVACVEREPRLGGVCLRVGCIPSKALLESSEHFRAARQTFGEHGVRVGGVELDLGAMMARKERVVEKLTGDVGALLARNKVEVVAGTARLEGPGTVRVEAGAPRTLKARFVLLAAGSEPGSLPMLPFDGERVVTSTEALSFEAVPEHLVVVGGGAIGLELGSVWARLGARVTVLEALPRIVAQLDGQVGRALDRSLRRQGLDLKVSTKLVSGSRDGNSVVLVFEAEDGVRQELRCDRVLVAVGRRPATSGLGLEGAGVALTPQGGRVSIDASYRTSAPGVYAIGDLVEGPMLAHKASAEGIAAVEQMAGLPGEVNYDAIPSVVYTAPEVAGVGPTEEELKARKVPYKAGVFPFTGVGRAWCAGATEGFCKVLAHSGTGRLLGVHLIGPQASELIAEGVVAVAQRLSAAELAGTVHGHPTLSEGLMEAARAAARH